MAYCFGDSFDLYATTPELGNGYWDSNAAGYIFQPGRFTGQCVQFSSSGALTKISGVNDAVHHIICAFRQTSVISGATLCAYFQLFDGATAQCSISFRQDGAILLQAGAPGGTTLATYTGAFPAANTWYAFEMEVVINNTTGSFTVRRNGNTSNDFTLGSLNTRGGTANNYANRLLFGSGSGVATQQMDDVLWRSDASSVAWAGDIRCYVRMPASDASTQFARSPSPAPISVALSSTVSDPTGTARYVPFTASYTGTVATIAMFFSVGFTGNCKLTIFADSVNNPGAILGSATTITNPVTGSNTFTFGTPVAVTRGTVYWVGVSHDVTAVLNTGATNNSRTSTTVAYASFPTASPAVNAGQNQFASITNITPTVSAEFVNETLQDGTTSYVYDSTVSDADFYNIAGIGVTPASVIAVTTRGFIEKSDAGTRSGAVQLKSGATTVQSASLALSTSFVWLFRTDTVDPNTSAAWTPANVNSVQIGPIVTV
jgi:hypothetical protein